MEAKRQERGRRSEGAQQGTAATRQARKVPVEAAVTDEALLPPIPAEVLPNPLRRGGRLCITGEDGVLTSDMLMQLAVCVASGVEWLGVRPAVGRVLLVCLAVGRPEALAAVLEVQRQIGADATLVGSNLALSCLAGRYLDAMRLTDYLAATVGRDSFDLVVLEGAHTLLPLAKDRDESQRLESAVTRLAGSTSAAVAFAGRTTHDAWASVLDVQQVPGGRQVVTIVRPTGRARETITLRCEDRIVWRDGTSEEEVVDYQSSRREELEQAIDAFMGSRGLVDRKAFCDASSGFRDPRTIRKYLNGSTRFEVVSGARSALIRRLGNEESA